MIDHERRLIFVHIPKCAGISIEEAMGGLPPEQRHLQHWSAGLYARYYPDCWRRYTRFAVVRDPVARALSFVRFLRRYDAIQRRHLGAVDEFALLRDTLMSANLLTTAPQAKMLRGDVELLRFERLAGDWSAFAARVGLPSTLPRRNRAPQSTRAEDVPPAIRAMVAALFAEDYARLDYDLPVAAGAALSGAELGWVRWAELRAAASSFPEAPSDGAAADRFRRWLGDWVLSLPLAWIELWGELVCARPPALGRRVELLAWTEAIHDDVNRRLGKPPWSPWRA